ncbi:hypothetical protein OAK75_13145 [Bacteriovoracales bacterium]|nr:hypothetical protein [Bacteriovoracales bacterium]
MKLMIVLATLFMTVHLFAHGGNKPGPHGGKIKMPGMFHTELLIKNHHIFRVYLLDMKFENPVIEKSKVQYSFNGSDKVICEPTKSYFLCETKRVIKGHYTLKLFVKRNKMKGVATYKNKKMNH